MPELPEVETVRRGLAPHLVGRRIEAVHCHRSDLRFPLPEMSVLAGQTCREVERRGKYLLFDFGELMLVWHLGMTGRFHVLPADSLRQSHEHVRLLLEGGEALVYRDARRFGYAGLLSTGNWQQHAWFSRLGPEPLDEDFNTDWLVARCKDRRGPVKPLLMHAETVVGVGNIYACESLFRAGIHPARVAGRISRERLQRLVKAVKEVLGEAISSGGSTISDFARVDGSPGYFAHTFAVYGRVGEPCPCCGGAIRRSVLSGRSSFYCPCCQH